MSGIAGGGGAFSKFAESGEFSIVLAGSFTFLHNFGQPIKGFELVALCKIPDLNYVAGDEFSAFANSTGGDFSVIAKDANSIKVLMPGAAPYWSTELPRSGGNMTPANWMMKLKVWS